METEQGGIPQPSSEPIRDMLSIREELPQTIGIPDLRNPEVRRQIESRTHDKVINFLTTFPQLPLSVEKPNVDAEGFEGTVEEFPLIDAMGDIRSEILRLSDIDEAQRHMKRLADTVLSLKRGNQREEDEAEGKWNASQELEFRRRLTFEGIVPADYANAPYAVRAMDAIVQLNHLFKLSTLGLTNEFFTRVTSMEDTKEDTEQSQPASPEPPQPPGSTSKPV